MISRRVQLYIFCTALAAVFAVSLLYARAPEFNVRFVQAVLCLSAVAALTQLLNFMVATSNATSSIVFIPMLAAAALAPSWITVVGAFLTAVTVQLTRRRGIIKGVFNVAQQCLSVTLSILVYLWFGGKSLLVVDHFPYLALVGLFATLQATNSLCVSGVVAIADRRSFWEIWSANTAGTLPYDLLSWPVIVGLAWVYIKYGAPGAFGLAIPLLGVRQLYKTNWELEQANQELLELMVAAIEARDPYTSGHSRRVAQNAKIIAEIIGLGKAEVRRVEIAALLHDVGKIHEVFAPILQKPGRLTDEEHAIMQTHAIKSEELVSKVSQLRDIVPAVRHHHENWDGTGYPDGIAGELIPLASRIIIFADTIDAMTSDRPYRKALDETAVRAELVKYRARQFDPQVCDALLSSPRYAELFAHAPHSSLPHTQEVPKLRLAVQS